MRTKLTAMLAILVVLTVACGPAPTPQVVEKTVVETVEVVKEVKVIETVEVEVVKEPTPLPPAEPPLFYALFATPIEEPWSFIVSSALQKAEDEGQIAYEWLDNLGYAGDMERVLREISEEKKPAAIFGDGYGNEEALRRVAADYPEIAFIFASALGPVEPNVSVFADVLYEPAYLLGLIGGGMTKSGTVGVVASLPVPEENKIINAFIAGLKEVNPETKVLVTFINSWFDPAAAKEAALAQIAAGADVLYAERFGVIAAADENGVWAFGHQGDQNELSPELVLSSTVWDFYPCVEYVLGQINAGTYTSQDLAQFSTMRKGGSTIASYHDTEKNIPAEVLDLVAKRQNDITTGLFQVITEVSTPEGAQ